MTRPTDKELYDPNVLMFYELCAGCTADFKKWQCAPNPANWNNPKIAENPYLLGFLQACRAAGPTPQEWRDTISRQLLLIRQICTRDHAEVRAAEDAARQAAKAAERPVVDVPLPLDSSQAMP
jgi:hypothetical protein